MDQQERLIKYIVNKRAQGVSDEAIRAKFLEVGVPEDRIGDLFAVVDKQQPMFSAVTEQPKVTAEAQPFAPNAPAPPSKPQPTFPVHRSLNRFHLHIHANRKVWLGIAVIILAAIAGTLWWSKNHSEAEIAQASVQRQIDDPNYSISLPIGWHPTSDYKPGAGLSMFYPKNQLDGSLVVYVLPFTTSSESSVAHAANKISELSRNGSGAKTLSTQQIQFGTTQGSLTTVLGSSARNPATEKSCYFFANVDYNNVAYNLDLTTGAADCEGQQMTAIQKALASFKPKATDLQYQQR
jgi:hypothetical protein